MKKKSCLKGKEQTRKEKELSRDFQASEYKLDTQTLVLSMDLFNQRWL